MYFDFVKCSGALTVLEAVRDKKMDVLLLEKGILDHESKTIQDFLLFAEEHGVTVEEIEIKAKGK